MKKYCMIIDTFQTFGESHKKLIESLIKEGKNVLLCISESDDTNPKATEIEMSLKRQLWRLMDDEKLKIVVISNIESINIFDEGGENLLECKVGK